MPAVVSAAAAPSLDAWNYWVDAWQRNLLFLDVMRQRSERYAEHAAKSAPHVLKFECDLVVDGRKLQRPVNYALVRVRPPHGLEIDEKKRPFVVVDPRAGHGPGIGGFKADSEIGVALKAGHPCYFIGFLPEPMPGQTIEDVAHAEVQFLERVIALHPEADGRPAVVGNCQAGWAVMIVAAMRPDLVGPVILAGAPLSYWNGVHGENPMRYTGGLVGGTWITALTGDLGAGKFDGAWLVTNFENLNPSNTYWSKSYNLYSKIDTEVPRFLEFEQWWGGHVNLNAEEMQFIADKLFVGNKLATGELKLQDGTRIDLRNIRTPIVVFCSKGDNITPPPQALGWILDLYGSVDDIRANGQTIVYSVHENIGHLGIFVSGSVAKKEHDEFASNIDLIDILPPGLYEAVMTPKDMTDPTADLVEGGYLVRFESRTLDDIRAFGGNTLEDERKFAAAARVSEINLGLYKTLWQPWVKMFANAGNAEMMRRMHQARLPYEMFKTDSPIWRTLDPLIESAKSDRHAVAQSNPFWQAQEMYSDWIIAALDGYRDLRDKWQEEWFHAFYGSPVLQAMLGLSGSEADVRPKPATDRNYQMLVEHRIEELKANMAAGGPVEAALRALLYIRLSEGAADERSLALLRRIRQEAGKRLPIKAFKKMLREQFFMLMIDERGALDAIPEMLARDPDGAADMTSKLDRMIEAIHLQNPQAKKRFKEMREIFAEPHAARGQVERPSTSPRSVHVLPDHKGHGPRHRT
ncbi:MAG: 3-hydroxyalkanoate synthetase [Hyphomicrobium sp. 32-62-53]|nr:MAG: 3-hydroxyalkanoate synthetase [Hyphomicrobium sp. 12-62-95]OYX99388.1 MAG: 3-hydroxyalkanoate synthetase [Hyphomicrobium sp. 32-62-53]